MENLITFEFEYTDTFNGETNYGWVKRAEFDFPANVSNSILLRKAKRVFNIHLLHKPVNKCGDLLTYDFYKAHTRLFISVKDV
jgi:hypothetical protein